MSDSNPYEINKSERYDNIPRRNQGHKSNTISSTKSPIDLTKSKDFGKNTSFENLGSIERVNSGLTLQDIDNQIYVSETTKKPHPQRFKLFSEN